MARPEQHHRGRGGSHAPGALVVAERRSSPLSRGQDRRSTPGRGGGARERRSSPLSRGQDRRSAPAADHWHGPRAAPAPPGTRPRPRQRLPPSVMPFQAPPSATRSRPTRALHLTRARRALDQAQLTLDRGSERSAAAEHPRRAAQRGDERQRRRGAGAREDRRRTPRRRGRRAVQPSGPTGRFGPSAPGATAPDVRRRLDGDGPPRRARRPATIPRRRG